MNAFLLALAVLTFGWRLKTLHDNRHYYLDLPSLKGNSLRFASDVVGNISGSLRRRFPAALACTVFLLLIVYLNLEEDAAFSHNRVAAALLFLIFIIYGAVFDVLGFLAESHLLRGPLPKKYGLLLADILLLLVPPIFLSLSAFGYDLRRPFLLLLAPVVILSLALKALYMLSNFKLF